jgi:hypothetical protein
MDAGAGLRRAMEELPAIDQHAHLLAGPEAGYTLFDGLSESRHAGQREEVRRHPSFGRAMRHLAEAVGVAPEEEALAAARREAGFESWTARLLEACRLEGMLVDDGFSFPGALPVTEHAALVRCPVRRLVRLEAVAEGAAGEWPVFRALREEFRGRLAAALEQGAVGFKTIAAYRCGLDLPPPDASLATDAYRHWRRSGSARLSDAQLISFFLAEALDVLSGRPVPLQVHTGLGDADLALHRADPSRLGPLLAEAQRVGVPVVLLHCYPFVRQAAWLAATHPHVHIDLSLALLLAGHRGAELVAEALELAPASRLLFATDAARTPEVFYLATRWWRDALAGALGRLVGEGEVGEEQALEWAGLVLAGNARRLYGLANWKAERGA